MNVAIVVAAGKGTRLGGDRPKQFLELGGFPIIIHTLRQFERSLEIDEVIAVLPPDETDKFLSFAEAFDLRKLARAIPGGARRAQSVLAGLSSIKQAEVVAVHDGVRPFVTPAEIDRVVQTASSHGAAILTAPVADTIKEISDKQVLRTLPRATLRRALTPQCFRFEILKQGYARLAEAESEGIEVTDDSLLVERLGFSVIAVEGSARNIKITHEEDLVLAEELLKKKNFVL